MINKVCLFSLVFFLGMEASANEFEFRDASRPTFEKAIDSDELAELARDQEVTILDVRLKEDFEAAPNLIPGAIYKDPEEITLWSDALPKDSKVVVYCVKGKWVSQKAASFLDEMGIDVYTLSGGINAWQSTQKNTAP